MSTEASSSTKETSEQQEELQPAAEAEANAKQAQDNAEGVTESSSSAGADDSSHHSAVSEASTRPRRSPQEGVAAGGVDIQDSQSSTSGGGGNTESQQGGATGSGSGTELQQGGATGGVGRQHSQESTASTDGNGTESQLLGAVVGTSRQDLEGSSSTGNSQETALVCDSGSRASLESGVAGGVSNSPDTQESPNDGTESSEGVAPPAAAVRQSVQRSPRVDLGEVNERAQEGEELMRSYDQCFNKCACVCDYLRPCSRWIRNSKIFMFLKMILFVIPISAFCMGLRYLPHCPVGNELPILMMLMGIAGVILLASSLALDSLRVFPGIRPIYFRALIIASRLMLLALFAAGLECTYKMSPSFDPSHHEHYCDMVFYYYAYYTNFVVIGIAVLSFFIYVPSLNENVEDYEHL